MRRILLLAAVLAVFLPAVAEGAVISTVSAGTLTVTGDGAGDTITVRLTSASTIDVNGHDFERASVSRVEMRSGAGDDTIRIVDALGVPVTVESGSGGDTVVGSAGPETIATGEDADFVQSGGGDDTVLLGNGDDTALMGDGFDAVDGQAGKDTLRALGSAESEEFTVQANGAKARIALDTRASTTDSAAVEAFDVVAAGGRDLVDIGALDSTAVRNVSADLGFLDAAPDAINVQGSEEFDFFRLSPAEDSVQIEDYTNRVTIDNAVAADDRLTIFAGGSPDIFSTDRALGERIALTLDGGTGQDLLEGTDAADVLRGGPDRDSIAGRKGDDTLEGGDGDDSFTRSTPDGHDRIEGGAGTDTLSAAGTGADELIDVDGLLDRTLLRYGSSGSADMGTVEQISMDAFGGLDVITIRDLTGTATTKVDVHSSSADLRTDTLTVHGTHGADHVQLTSEGTTHTVSGLPATVNYVRPERGEKLAIDAEAGKDVMDASGLTRDTLQPTLRGGADRDTILGSSSDDTIAGGADNDNVFMAGGLDTYVWEPGDGSDSVEGQSGTDFLQMTGSGGNDRFDVLPAGSRTRVTRDIEGVTLDLGGLERLDVVPGPGGDIVRVGDLSGTSTTHVHLNLAVARGTLAGDNLIDRVFIDGALGNDTINVHGAGSSVLTSGLAATTTILGTDPELDRLHVDTKPGPDTLTVTGTTNQLLYFTSS